MTRLTATTVLTASLCCSGPGPLGGWTGTVVVAQSQEWRPADAAVDALVKQVLEERLADGDIPDIGLLDGAKRITIRADLPSSRLILSSEALPRRPGYEFRLVSTDEAVAEAERTKTRVFFITIDRFETLGERATMWIGTDFVLPSEPTVLKMCCCEGEVHYRRTSNGWEFARWGEQICR